jgi:hypothetical protein
MEPTTNPLGRSEAFTPACRHVLLRPILSAAVVLSVQAFLLAAVFPPKPLGEADIRNFPPVRFCDDLYRPLVALFSPGMRARIQCTQNLKQIFISCHNYAADEERSQQHPDESGGP